MSDHAFLAPSSAHIWVDCALAPSLMARYPETEPSPESLEGTAAHWVAQQMIEGATPAPGVRAPNGVTVTAEMIEGGEILRDDVLAVAQGAPVQMEHRVHAKRVHPTQNWGTLDCRVAQGPRLTIWDYKFGHRAVDAFENWQLINYAAGWLDELGGSDLLYTFDLRVVQPRAYRREGPAQSWVVNASELRGYINRLNSAAEWALVPKPPASPGASRCRDCKGRHACEALQRAAGAAGDRGKHHLPLDLPDAALGLELRNLTEDLKLIEARVDGLREEALARATRQGRMIPHWKAQTKYGRLTWNVSADEVLAVGALMGKDLAAPPSPITPAQAKKAGVPEAVVNLYTHRPSGGAELVPDDDKLARLTFGSSNA